MKIRNGRVKFATPKTTTYISTNLYKFMNQTKFTIKKYYFLFIFVIMSIKVSTIYFDYKVY